MLTKADVDTLQRVEPQLVTAGEIAARYGKHRNTIHKWVERYSDFPPAVLTVGLSVQHTKVYDAAAVERWVRHHGFAGGQG